MSLFGLVALGPVAHAQLTFTQSATVTLTDSKVIGVAYSPTDSRVYVAADGNVQPYDLTLTTADSNFPDFAGIQNYMNLGPTGTLTFSTFGSGLRSMNISDYTPAGIGFGPSQATSISRQVTIGSTDYRVFYDSSDSSVKLTTAGPGFAGTTTTIFTLAASGLSNIAAVDFAYTGSTTAASYMLATSSAGLVREYTLGGTYTGNSTSLALIGLNSNDTISGFSYNSGKLAYSVYNPDFNVSVANFGTFTGTAVPEPSTYAAIFGICALGLAAYRRHRGK